MQLIEKIIFIVIPLVAVGIIAFFLFFSGGGFDAAVNLVNSTQSLIPDESIYDDAPTKAAISAQHRAQIENLHETINKMLASPKTDCFAKYSGFNDFGEGGPSITMQYESGKTQFSVLGGAGGQQIITDLLFEIPGMQPCVIAGSESVTETFNNKFIKQESNPLTGYYTPISGEIKIHYFTGTSITSGVGSCTNGNQILVPELGPGIVNDECDNFEDGGMLFKSPNNQICFFPTVYGTFDREQDDGLQNDYVGGTEKTGLRMRLQDGTIEKCFI